jgi:hypothetical protein
VFASLLDSGRGGCFAVRSEAVRTRQLYKPGTNVLVTRFLGAGSVGEVVDFMVVFTITCRPAVDFGRQDHAVHAPGHGGAVFNSPGAQAWNLASRPAQYASVRSSPTSRARLAFSLMEACSTEIDLENETVTSVKAPGWRVARAASRSSSISRSAVACGSAARSRARWSANLA